MTLDDFMRARRISRSKRASTAVLRGPYRYGRKLTDDQVRDVRRRHAAGEGYRTIATDYGMTRDAVRKIVRRTTYQDVSDT